MSDTLFRRQIPKTHHQQQFQFSTREIKKLNYESKPWKDERARARMQKRAATITNNIFCVDIDEKIHFGRLKGSNSPVLKENCDGKALENDMGRQQNSLEWKNLSKKSSAKWNLSSRHEFLQK